MDLILVLTDEDPREEEKEEAGPVPSPWDVERSGVLDYLSKEGDQEERGRTRVWKKWRVLGLSWV